MRAPTVLRRIHSQISEDIRNDATLRYILVVAALLGGFWFWYRVPNFGTPDEYSRLIDPMTAAGYFVQDPGVDSLIRGVTDGRALGATFYLYGLVLVPVFIGIVLSGQLGTFRELGTITSRWTLWHSAPAWFWTAIIVLGRLVVVTLAIGCVYTTYRLGTEIHNRNTGRIAAGFLTVSVGFLSTAHEVNEDIPMLFLFLLAVLLSIRYVRTNSHRYFYLAALLGGLGIAFKLTAGAIIFVLGSAYLLRANVDGFVISRGKIRLFALGIIIGGSALIVGMPSVLVGGPDGLIRRLTLSIGQKTTEPQPFPSWYYLLSGYLNAFGLPLFVGTVAGVLATLRLAWSNLTDRNGVVILTVGLVVYLLVFSRWQWVRTHHILPTLPLLLVLFGIAGAYVIEHRSRIWKLLLVGLLLTTGLYASFGVIGYATDPRDSATSWLANHNVSDGDVEVYEDSVADVGIPHGVETSHYQYSGRTSTYDSTNDSNESDYTEWLLDMPTRQPRYIELTSSDLAYLDRDSPLANRFPRRAEFFRNLSGGNYAYEVAETFGNSRSNSLTRRLLLAGIIPRVEQRVPRVIIFERKYTGTAEVTRERFWE